MTQHNTGRTIPIVADTRPATAQAAEQVAQRTRAPILLGPQQAASNSSLRSASYKLVTETAARLLKTPQYIILFVSDKCWMKCSHCWFNEDWMERELTHTPLSFDEYEKMARSMSQVAFITITGGEAFSRRDIVELATMLRKTTKLRRFQIPTSGYRTDMIVQASKDILEANPDTPFRVDVSLDGIEEIHNSIRHIKNGFEKAVDTIKALNELKKHYKHFDVGVITTISNLNQHVVRETSALVESIHPEGEWLVNIARGNGRDQRSVEVDPQAYRLAQTLIEERKARGAYKGHGGHWTAKWLSAKNSARRDIIYDIINGEGTGGGCSAGSVACMIQSDGTVKACEMLDEPMGNLRDFDYDLGKLWQSQAARKMRHFIQDSNCMCTQECFLSTSMLMSPNALGRIAKERWKLGFKA